jgi:hypothetical protein
MFFFHAHDMVGSIACFATGEVVMTAESEFFRTKSFVACIFRCEAWTSAELMT